MTLYAPSQMFEHGFDAKKGWFDMSSLDFAALMSANVTFTVPRGRVVHLNTSGQWETGASSKAPAVFLLQGQTDPDVSNPTFTSGGIFVQQAIAPIGIMSGLVATGGYELDSTEFDTTKNYTPGDLLTSVINNTTIAIGGVVTNAGSGNDSKVKQFVDPVIGVVTVGGNGGHLNQNGVATLGFWTVYVPGAALN